MNEVDITETNESSQVSIWLQRFSLFVFHKRHSLLEFQNGVG